jgi:uncharacterized membrane protein
VLARLVHSSQDNNEDVLVEPRAASARRAACVKGLAGIGVSSLLRLAAFPSRSRPCSLRPSSFRRGTGFTQCQPRNAHAREPPRRPSARGRPAWRELLLTTFIVLKFLHVVGAIVILGTGIGIAFFMLIAHRSGDAAHIARTAATVVLADGLFTATAVVIQPVTGALLLRATGVPLTEGWVLASLALYGLAGATWLPVVWIQARMRDLAREAATSGSPLPARYHSLYRLWLLAGFPGFGCVLAILWLMLAKPLF